MRYFDMILHTTADRIRKGTTIKLNEYVYNNTIAAVNSNVYQTIENGISFIIYRERENGMHAAMAYDEKRHTFSYAYGAITGLLKEKFRIRKLRSGPEEITMLQCIDKLDEGYRRDYITGLRQKYVETAKLCAYNYAMIDKETMFFDFKESIVSAGGGRICPMYGEEYRRELSNISQHQNLSSFTGNMVHYMISARSAEAACDMTETLMARLLAAGRISGRRMEIISEIHPQLHKSDLLEKIIENNSGGVIVIRLEEKFGYDPVDYGMAVRYLEKLVKAYRNDCLFVFTYDMEHPGFAYSLLKNLQKYVRPVALREGKGNRRAATSYLKQLIKKSEYAQYAGQAGEFLKQYPGTEFTQTDILAAYERFEPWCVNKNILQAYDDDLKDDFFLDRDSNAAMAGEKLEKLIGLAAVKKQIQRILAADIVEKERKNRKGSRYQTQTMHMVFGGNPGSAKTTVARLFAGIAKENGVLKSGAFVELGGMDLAGLGCVSKIREAFEAAKGGVLFIDEAYTLQGDTAVSVLIREMEDHRDEVIVIFAGYNGRMQNFLKINEGLKSRIPYWIEFPDYDENELTEIFRKMVSEKGFSVTEDAVREAHYIFEKARHMDNFGNGRYVRNLIENAIQRQSARLLSERGDAGNIRKKELFLLTKEDVKDPEGGRAPLRIREAGTAAKELEEMVGLTCAKQILRKALAGFKRKRLCLERGIDAEKPSMHMVFTGNPGTAKTTVARLFAEILKDEKVLPSGNFVEVGRAELVTAAVGETPSIVKARFEEAQGGVLFIDEAYALCDAGKGANGDEAINTIVQEMENRRDNVIVIFAGYPEPMKEFLDRNPGMASRIAFQVDFEDYSVEELCDITRVMAKRKQLVLTDGAMEKLRGRYETVLGSKDYGNGRFVRKQLEEAEMNLALRLFDRDGSPVTTEQMTTIEACDIPGEFVRMNEKKIPFGFCA